MRPVDRPGPVILEGVKPVALELGLLKQAMPELALRPGSVVAARIIQRAGDRGLMSLAGRQLEATLPSGLEAGRTVRLEVEEVTAERVLLRVSDPLAPPPAAIPIPLPGGVNAHV